MKIPRPHAAHRPGAAFTLVELLVSMAILLLMAVLIFQMINSTSLLWQRSRGKVEAFQGARAGFEALTRKLSQATLNTYWDYYGTGDTAKHPGEYRFFAEWGALDRITPPAVPPDTQNARKFAPIDYRRYSELHMIAGSPSALGASGLNIPKGADPLARPTHGIFFQAPLGYTRLATHKGLASMLNAVGYFVEYGDDTAELPPFVAAERVARGEPPAYRFRLKEMIQPSENFTVYDSNATSANPKVWFQNALTLNDAAVAAPDPATRNNITVHTIAPNIVALILLPIQPDAATPLAPNYTFDSRNPTDSPFTTGTPPPQQPQQHQLPGLVQITFIAIDELSAARVQLQSSDPTVPPDLLAHPTSGVRPAFALASAYAADMEDAAEALIARGLNYRIFTTNVSIRAAKWSAPQ